MKITLFVTATLNGDVSNHRDSHFIKCSPAATAFDSNDWRASVWSWTSLLSRLQAQGLWAKVKDKLCPKSKQRPTRAGLCTWAQAVSEMGSMKLENGIRDLQGSFVLHWEP